MHFKRCDLSIFVLFFFPANISRIWPPMYFSTCPPFIVHFDMSKQTSMCIFLENCIFLAGIHFLHSQSFFLYFSTLLTLYYIFIVFDHVFVVVIFYVFIGTNHLILTVQAYSCIFPHCGQLLSL